MKKVLLVAVCTCAVFIGAVPGQAEARSCGRVPAIEGTSMIVRANGVGCSFARQSVRTILRWNGDVRTGSWYCSISRPIMDKPGQCWNSRRSFSWRPNWW